MPEALKTAGVSQQAATAELPATVLEKLCKP